MTVNLVPVDAWPANFTEAADGDAVSQATRTNVAQEFADASTYLYNRNVDAKGGNYPIPIAPMALNTAGWTQRWQWDTTNNGWSNFSIAGADEIAIPLPSLFDCGWTSVTLVVHGDCNGVGPHAGLPGSMPRITLYSIDGSGASKLQSLGSATDTSASVGAYETLHTITYTPGATKTIDSVNQYVMSVRGESGANAVANALVILGAYMTVVAT